MDCGVIARKLRVQEDCRTVARSILFRIPPWDYACVNCGIWDRNVGKGGRGEREENAQCDDLFGFCFCRWALGSTTAPRYGLNAIEGNGS